MAAGRRDEAPRYARKPEGLTPLVDYGPVTGKWFNSGAKFLIYGTCRGKGDQRSSSNGPPPEGWFQRLIQSRMAGMPVSD